MQLGFSLRKYVRDVVLPISKTCLFAGSLPVVLHYSLSKSVLSSCGVGIFTLIWSAAIVFYVGLDRREKQMVANRIPPFLRKALLPR